MTVPNFRVVAEGLRFPEGPIALPDGSVLVVEILAGRLTRVAPDGAKQVVAVTGGGPNGAAIGPDGKCYVCNNGGFSWAQDGEYLVVTGTAADYRGGSIQRVDLPTGTVETLYAECGDQQLKGPNDIVFAREGGFWFTDPGKFYPRTEDVGAVYYAKADGSLISEQVYPHSQPNGIGLSSDEGRLYVSETRPGRVWHYDLSVPGQAVVPSGFLNGSALLYGAPGFHLFDSMALEAGGNLCVATVGTGGITVLSPRGELVEFVPLPDPATTNICFGGPDLRTAFITLSYSGRLIAMDWPRPGLPLNFLNR